MKFKKKILSFKAIIYIIYCALNIVNLKNNKTIELRPSRTFDLRVFVFPPRCCPNPQYTYKAV